MQKDSKIGILLPHLGRCQAAHYAIKYVNYLITSKNSKLDFVLFYEDLFQPPLRPLCASLNISEIWSFDGVLISTNIENTLTSINALTPTKRIFYIWDVEWLQPQHKDYVYNIKAYRDPRVTLISRSQQHATLIDKYANRKVDGIVRDFNLIEILEKFIQ